MRNVKMTIWVEVMAAILCINTNLSAVPIDRTFTGNGVIQDGDDYDDVWVYDTPPNITIVDMTGGEVAILHTHDQSITNIMDGLVAYSNSYDQSTINISGGVVHTAQINNDSTTNVTGGVCWNVEVGGGKFNISGGQITGSGIYVGSGVVNIYGYGFEYDPYHTPNLTGFWSDNTPFGINFWAPGYTQPHNSYDYVVLHEIPEPTTLSLLGLGAVILRKRKK
jgi:hypothetical protein